MPARVFNRIARTYDHDWASLYAQSRKTSAEQLLRAACGKRSIGSALDLAVGTGSFYEDLAPDFKIERRYGLDISAGMLEVAQSKLDGEICLIRDSALNAEAHVPPASQDLVLCHYLFSYVDPAEVLPLAHRLLKPGGLLSLATSTRRSLQELHRGRFQRTGRLLGVQRALERAFTPADHPGAVSALERHGFEIVDSVLQRQPVVFRSFADVRAWGLDSGWAAGYLDGRLGWRVHAARLAFAAAEALMRDLYPVQATSEVSIILGRAVVGEADSGVDRARERLPQTLTADVGSAAGEHRQ